jgi:hypothetical protein
MMMMMMMMTTMGQFFQPDGSDFRTGVWLEKSHNEALHEAFCLPTLLG